MRRLFFQRGLRLFVPSSSRRARKDDGTYERAHVGRAQKSDEDVGIHISSCIQPKSFTSFFCGGVKVTRDVPTKKTITICNVRVS